MKRACAFLLALTLVVGACLPSALAFEERPSSWAAEEVSRAVDLGLVPDTLQSSWQQPITRVEFTRLALQFLAAEYSYDDIPAFVNDYMTYMPGRDEKPGEGEDWWGHFSGSAGSFVDLPDRADWGYVCSAHAIGLVNGTDETHFNPAGSITRQEAACMLMRSYQVMDQADYRVAIYSVFDDYDQMGTWAIDNISAAVGLKVMNGVSDVLFAPLDTYTREQAVTTFLRLYEDAPVGAAKDNVTPLSQRAYELAMDHALYHLGHWESEVKFRADIRQGTILALGYGAGTHYYDTLMMVYYDGTTRTLWDGATTDWSLSADETTLTFTANGVIQTVTL